MSFICTRPPHMCICTQALRCIWYSGLDLSSRMMMGGCQSCQVSYCVSEHCPTQVREVLAVRSCCLTGHIGRHPPLPLGLMGASWPCLAGAICALFCERSADQLPSKAPELQARRPHLHGHKQRMCRSWSDSCSLCEMSMLDLALRSSR